MDEVQYTVKHKTGRTGYIRATGLQECIVRAYNTAYNEAEAPEIESITHPNGTVYSNILLTVNATSKKA